MDWNYVAGFFDGEGCVLNAMYGKQRHLTFTNTNFDVLEQIKNFFGLGLLFAGLIDWIDEKSRRQK